MLFVIMKNKGYRHFIGYGILNQFKTIMKYIHENVKYEETIVFSMFFTYYLKFFFPHLGDSVIHRSSNILVGPILMTLSFNYLKLKNGLCVGSMYKKTTDRLCVGFVSKWA